MYQCLNISSNIRLRSFHRIIKRFVVKGPPTPFHWFGGPSETIQNIILCSGQGSQYVGMFHELSREKRITPEILSLFRTANDILGYDIIQVCIEGPKAKLDKTIHCQPAVLLANLVGTALLKEKKPWIFQTNVHIAGYSLGEIAALHLAGSITVEEAFIIVKSRAEAMQKASDISAAGLYFIHGIYIDELTKICHDIAEAKRAEKPSFASYAGIAIDSYPRGCVVGATIDCEKDILALAAKRIIVTELPVSGAFHTPLMKPAQEIFKKTLDTIDIKMPKYNLYSNVTGDKYTSPEEIKRLLVRQLVEPVQWQSIVKKIYKKTLFCRTCEVGAGHQLKVILGKYDRNIMKKYFNYKV